MNKPILLATYPALFGLTAKQINHLSDSIKLINPEPEYTSKIQISSNANVCAGRHTYEYINSKWICKCGKQL